MTNCEHRFRNRVSSLHQQNIIMANKRYIKELNYGKVTVVENNNHQWAVIDSEGNFIVPFGKYGWIDGFDSGLARVRTNKGIGYVRGIEGIVLDLDTNNPKAIEGEDNVKKYFEDDRKQHPDHYARWGIINEEGEEVLPLEYDSIWKFLGKGRYSTKVEKNGYTEEVFFHDLNPSLPDRRHRFSSSSYNNDGYGTHYGEYAGSYAQDVMGYSDDVIDDAFDGDPDAYWNID